MEKKRLILVVEDDSRFRKWISGALERAGYRTETAEDGLVALEKLERERPDLILLGVMMRRMDGFEVLKHLKTDPATAAIPIVLLIAQPALSRPYQAIHEPEDLFPTGGTAEPDFNLVVIKALLRDPAELIRAIGPLCPPT